MRVLSYTVVSHRVKSKHYLSCHKVKVDSLTFSVLDGFTFLKKHHTALTQRLKSVQSLMDHLLEENVISQEEYDTIRNCTSVKRQTAQLIDLVLSKGNAAAEVFRNWIKKNDVYLLRELMGINHLPS